MGELDPREVVGPGNLVEMVAQGNKMMAEGWHRQGLLAGINVVLLLWKSKLGWQ